jgi:dihydrofolate reductase
MTNSVYVATSLDNFIATREGGLEWLNEVPNPGQSDYGFAEFMSRIDAVVMGRNTFETVIAFDSWPYPVPVFVLSASLKTLPGNVAGKAEIILGDPRDLVKQLNERGYRNLYIDGGRTIQCFLQEDLIDEMIITRVPVLLGEGIPFFGNLENSLNFRLEKTEQLNDALVKSSYSRIRA